MATIDDILSAVRPPVKRAALDRLFAFLSIPSIFPLCRRIFPDCDRAAELAGHGIRRSLDSRRPSAPTTGRPMVVGPHQGLRAARRRMFLFYGHYDVQPVDPLNLWRKPAVRAKIGSLDHRAEEIRGPGGACDDKGQLMTFLEACRAFKQFGGPPLPLNCACSKAEEETGFAFIASFPGGEREGAEGRCVALVCDSTGMWDRSHAGDHDRACAGSRPKRS